MEARKMEANEMAMTQSKEHAAKEFNFTNWLIDYIDSH